MMWNDLISNDKLVSSPASNDSIGVWTDYCELLCMSSDNMQIDQDEISSIIIKSLDFQNIESLPKGRKERLTSKLEDVYSHIMLRNNILSERYPYYINKDGQLCLKNSEVSELQALYLLLLLSSNLKYTKKIHGLTSDFEVICLLYMRRLFPSMIFKLFGSSNINNKLTNDDCISDTKLKERMVKLSEFVSVSYKKDSVDHISDMDHGDNGLDIVGIRKMGDDRKSIPIMFGQCACSREEWSEKQYSLSNDHWAKYLEIMSTSIQKYIFIPDWYMNSEKQFENELDITSCILVDRLRIMKLADNSFISNCCSLRKKEE